MNNDLARTMSRIQKLLAQADHPNTSVVEAATFRERAEGLMRQYRVDEESLIASDASAVQVQMHSMYLFQGNAEFRSQYWDMLYYITEHAGVKSVLRYNNDGEDYGLWVDLFGYESDLRIVEWLWSSARLVFGSHLEPVVDPSLSDQVNAYRLRASGMKRREVACELWGANANTANNRAKVQRLYVAECRKRGVEPALTGLGTDADTFRASYATGFVTSLYGRLRAARDAADSVGGAIVFPGREERILEVLYRVHPSRRPKPPSDDVAPVDTTPVKKDRRRKDWTQADERRYQRRNGAAAQSGRRAGIIAAQHVTVDRTHTPAQRLDG